MKFNTKVKNEYIHTESNNNEIVSRVLQVVAYDYHVRLIKCGYGEIIDHSTNQIICDNKDDIQWKCIDIASETRYTSNIYDENPEDCLMYIIKFRLLGNYYIAHGKDPLTTWAIVIRTAREENRKIFSRYPDRQKIK